MNSAAALSPAVHDAASLMRDERIDVADTAAAIIASMCHPDMVSSLWPLARLGQRERQAFGVLFLHFVAGGFTAAEQRFLNFEVAQHRLRRTPSAPFAPPQGQVR
jgi:hypothetical protein